MLLINVLASNTLQHENAWFCLKQHHALLAQGYKLMVLHGPETIISSNETLL